MIIRFLDPWFLLRLYEIACWTAVAIVAAGIAAEFACLLFLWISERPRKGVGPCRFNSGPDTLYLSSFHRRDS